MTSGAGNNGEGKLRPGNPKSGKSISPKDLRQIEEWHLMGVSIREIGRRLGFSGEAIRHHVKNRIEPQWAAQGGVSLRRELRKIDLVERISWEKFLESQGPERIKTVREVLSKEGVPAELVTKVTKWRTGEGNWLDFVKWSIEMRAKLGGLLVDRHEHRHEVGVRVAGLKPEELTATILAEILQRVKDRRLQREALEGPSEDVV